MTPSQKRYAELTNEYPNAIILMQMGQFCEVFGPAAHDAANALRMIVTHCHRIGETPMPLMGFPLRCRSMHTRTLVEAGRTVVFVKQLPNGSGWEAESITTPGAA